MGDYAELNVEQRQQVDCLLQEAMKVRDNLPKLASCLKAALHIIEPWAIFPIELDRRSKQRE